MSKSIPANALVSVLPSVLGAGGSQLSLNAVMLTENSAIPIGAVLAFSNTSDVQAFFGLASIEATLAGIYFAGFKGANTLPGTLYFSHDIG